MIRTTYLLIGGGVSSARAVESIRQTDRAGTITLVGREPELPYDRPPLSKELLRAEVRGRSIRCKPRRYFRRQSVSLYLGRTVERLTLDSAPRVADLSDGTKIAFEKCLIATGAEPARLPVTGSDLEGIHLLRTVADMRAIVSDTRAALRKQRARPPVIVIGAGFIGMELAASLTTLGLAVTVVEKEWQAWPGFADAETARIAADHLTSHGVTLLFGETVTEFRAGRHAGRAGAVRLRSKVSADRVASVRTASGKELQCSMVCVAVGVRPNVALAEAAGLEVSDGVVVDRTLEARFANGNPAHGVYAAGDIARYPDPYFSRGRRVEHFGQAEYTGLLAGMNMAGASRPYDLLTYVWSDLFDMHIECAGLPGTAERTLVRGATADNRFVTLSLSGGKIVGFLAVNWPEAEFGPLRFLIQQGTDITGREELLLDSTRPLAPLMA